MIQGTQFGPFLATGKRRILYYQGDESEGDMVQALETLGYSENDINKYVRVRFSWSAENMPTLIQDLKEFQPDMVVIDSLSTANRFSVYRESEMEYARPILEMTGLANQFKTTFVIIHHTNREGGVRGTTAIRNAVSEVWRLTKDTSQTATPNDRILEIDKSRSRSSGKKYRLMFNPEDLTFTFLGEEGEQFGSPGQTAKERTLDFLAANRNIRFTSQEIAHSINVSKDYARRYLAELASDGLVSVSRRPGKTNTYFLAYEELQLGSPLDHPRITLGSPQDHPSDHPSNVDRTSNSAKADPQGGDESFQKKGAHPGLFEKPTGTPQDHLSPNALENKGFAGDPGGVHQGDRPSRGCEQPENEETGLKTLPDNVCDDFSQGDPQQGSAAEFGGDARNTGENAGDPHGSQAEQNDRPRNQPFTVAVEGELGVSTATVSQLKAHKKYLRVQIDYTFADGSTKQQKMHVTNRNEAEVLARTGITRWQNEITRQQNEAMQTESIAL